ncbi:MAG: aminoglycoside phosphotransferase family protein, partial [Magnetococcales bacterium]|nr:aminoglycoside phosphotransferase family protein [Magnetococcales bacterium]
MEENIHIHFRDLRIELSRGEFEDICEAFGKQSQELLAIIQQKNYQDGKLANANQDDVRIWTESKLKHEVKYHPQRLSIESCTDGYHLHYRNYKILIDETDFRQLVTLFGHLDIDGPFATTYPEVLELLEANDLDFTLSAGTIPNEVLALNVALYHLPKIRDIFKQINFTHEATPDGACYQGPKLKVLVKADKSSSPLDFRRQRALSKTERLVEFLTRQGSGMDCNLINRIKCQVLDLYYALRGPQPLSVETNPQLWLYVPFNEQVIFPYSNKPAGPNEAKVLYRDWSVMLGSVGLSFIKPDKIRFEAKEQAILLQQVNEALNNSIATCGAVERIQLMGSTARGEMGYYLAPFVHGPNAKLGSDVDILIEIHPLREKDIPPQWHLVNPESSNGNSIYHITQIPLAKGDKEWTERYPHITFTHHLVDAYVFFPSRGKREETNAFLRKFSPKLFYDRQRDGIITVEGDEKKIAQQLTELYDLKNVIVEPFKVSTENLLYKVFTDKDEFILKLFKVSGNYKSVHITEHVAYEAELIPELIARGIVTAAIIPSRSGGVTTVNGYPALLFERIQGAVQSRPEYPLEKIAPALAELHRVQMASPMTVSTAFTFEDYCHLWLPFFDVYHREPTLSSELKALFDRLAPWAKQYQDESVRKKLYLSSPAVHNHGDVTPKNVMLNQNG